MTLPSGNSAEELQAKLLRRLEGVSRLQEDLLLPGSLTEKLKKVTDTAVELLDLDFCRIWVIGSGDLCDCGCIHAVAGETRPACLHRDRCLHLMVSSGRYTHIDGGHRRVPLGYYKVGRVATGETNKFLTNSVTTDPQVADHAWAKRLGLVSFAGYKLRDSDGEPMGVLAMFAKQPLSEEDDAFMLNLAETTSRVILEDRASQELRRTRAEAIEANQAKSRFLATMSHEIRTPMTAILGFTDLLAETSLTASAQNNYLAVIRHNGEHLLGLINEILDLSKIEAGRLTMNMGRCNLASLLVDVVRTMQPRASARGNTLTIEFVGEIPETIHADSARLRQAVVNLAGNALKFTEHGQVRIRAVFLPEWRDGRAAVSIEVIDTGIGISQETIPKLFQPFTQADSRTSRRFGGTGLGLTISRHLAEMHGGELTVRSELGQGSVFTLTIPTGNVHGIRMLRSPEEAVVEPAEEISSCKPHALARSARAAGRGRTR